MIGNRIALVVTLAALLVSSGGTLSAQGVYRPGSGVTLPRVVKEVQPTAAEIAGTVMLDCVVREDGNLSDIKVQKSPDPKLDQPAIDTLNQWKFEPGKKDGKPVAVAIHVELTFKRR